jgi:hypothetical protein
MHNPKGRSAFWIYRAIGLGHFFAVPLNDFEGSLVGCRPQPWTSVHRHGSFPRELHGLHTVHARVSKESFGVAANPEKDLTFQTLRPF